MKKNKKRGRPKIIGQLREPNGRISRAKSPREAVDKLALETRAKRFGLTLQEAKNPLAGSYIGRLCLQGVLTQDQYDAAQKYLQIRNDYLCAKGLPSAVYDDVTTNSDPNSLEQWVEKATNHYQAVQEVIKEAQCLYRQYNLYAALQYLVIEDQMLPHLVSSLRIALNALQKYLDR
ncbi:hypothetical protein ME1_00801 [Bartonella vinsonii subsp. arupensis OK-94-513]|uniref:Uncharacterized protein n=2 Tax=Bartonella vinsonii subsp. arupensis TaxID=110578 RepID=J0QY41_BARVI|nr:hypothetical protein [Bartonella vinsonii]EJF88114.1 hypothetical protein ME1_00801 [Bartonella vinsonii subsp. arupensis OK-94-513]EJF96882.1 hypothetical protein MEI_01494 [Bartonella vinsonii subsp. arupensis Pm136co]